MSSGPGGRPAIPNTGLPDPARTFAVQRAAQQREPGVGWSTRARRLRALETLIRDNRDAIAAAISADFGHRPAEETDLLEVFPTLSAIRYALRRGQRWMRPRRHWAGFWFLPARTELRPQPLGVVGIIVPWNYPLYLAAGPLTDALAAGNRVLVKMSEFTPRFSALFAELVATQFAIDEVAVVTGGEDVARAFSALAFDHLLFTGSTPVGREVMRAAAENLTPVTLELGGKSPALIGPGARFSHAVERIVLGKLLNAGQTCIAPDYVLLPRCAHATVRRRGACGRRHGCTRISPAIRSTRASLRSAIMRVCVHCAMQPGTPERPSMCSVPRLVRWTPFAALRRPC